MIAKEKKQAIIAEYGRTPGDTGSPEVQIAGLFKEDGYRKISFFDRTFRNQKVMSLKNRAEVYSALFL